VSADHQSYIPGQLQIRRGADDLLINAHAPGKSQPAWRRKNVFGNVIVIDDNGDKLLPYPETMGVWYGKPGVVVTAYRAEKDYVYLGGDYHAAYSPPSKPGSGGPAQELTRQVVYLRPNYVVVYDRATTLKESYGKDLRWHFLKAPTVSGTAFEAAAGDSKLFGKTFSTVPLVTSAAPVKVGEATVHQLRTHAEKPIKTIRFVTVFQVASSAAKSMMPARHLTDAGGLLEGAQIEDDVVLFGRAGSLGANAALRVKATGKGTLRHLVTDLPPGQAFQVKVDGKPTTRVVATAQGTIIFKTEAAGERSVEVAATR
jgi:hypothetical protein